MPAALHVSSRSSSSATSIRPESGRTSVIVGTTTTTTTTTFHVAELHISTSSTDDGLFADTKLIALSRTVRRDVTSDYLITFRVSRRRREMYSSHARLSACLSAAACSHYCTDPDVTWGSGRGCPLVVHYWADLQWVHGLLCYGDTARPATHTFIHN